MVRASLYNILHGTVRVSIPQKLAMPEIKLAKNHNLNYCTTLVVVRRQPLNQSVLHIHVYKMKSFSYIRLKRRLSIHNALLSKIIDECDLKLNCDDVNTVFTRYLNSCGLMLSHLFDNWSDRLDKSLGDKENGGAKHFHEKSENMYILLANVTLN